MLRRVDAPWRIEDARKWVQRGALHEDWFDMSDHSSEPANSDLFARRYTGGVPTTVNSRNARKIDLECIYDEIANINLVIGRREPRSGARTHAVCRLKLSSKVTTIAYRVVVSKSKLRSIEEKDIKRVRTGVNCSQSKS
ncbi:hypothetical protein EVAR_80406_1 [Eumeta japonica]|uniref:Uncharacterized protein n=1 Tax=Eumeta variegata TaxID=151549 RepID=A0A4C1VHJ8_EUMVA|nr:hypothetical protein EVAR_80406_1 [Eumeta japonica]